VKAFPAGNVTTSFSRTAFLRSLCSLPKFSTLVDFIQPVVKSQIHLAQSLFEMILFQPKPSKIPSRYPSWASWSSHEVYLPASFHSSKSFNSALAMVREDLENPVILESGKIDSPLLLLGLIYQEVSRVMELEPGNPPNLPSRLINSPFGINEVDKIRNFLNDVDLDNS
jgi:hypothetical protein